MRPRGPDRPRYRAARVTAEIRHSPESDPPERWPWGIAAVALVAGLLQVVASIVLGLARLDRFLAAANESPTAYLVVAALIGAAALSIWMVRERPPIAMALLMLWPIGLWYGLRSRITVLGLAYHGEFVLHHFAALLCLILVIAVPIGWARDRRLGPARFVPAALAIPGALLLAGAHLGQIPIGPMSLASRTLSTTGAALLVITWPCAAALFWKQLGPLQRRPLALVLMLPIALRIGLAGPHALSGELVTGAGITTIGAAIIVTAFATLVLLRPRVEPWVLVVVGLICLVGCLFFFSLYQHGFGEFEAGLGGLLQSLFGFVVPYPTYVGDVRSAALMMGLFFMFVTVYAALVSAEDRVRGIALGLMAIAGLGFSSPHLVLMLGAGALLLIEGLLPGAPYRKLEPSFDLSRFEAEIDEELGPDLDKPLGGTPETGTVTAVRTVVESLAERLGLAPPTCVETGPDAAMIGLRGEVDGPFLDLRARIDRSATRIEIVVGLPGLGDPVFELIPDPGKRGQRPAHLVARSHRVHGELRALEAFGDGPLDALSSFPTAYLRAWDGGVQIDLGRELHGLRVDNLEALVRSLTRVVG
jgi:hypothetical protein